MSKKISEMTLEELQDHALQLEAQLATANDTIAERDTTIEDLNNTNLMLQQRNNRLFMQVEQGVKDPEEKEEEVAEVETCEAFAEKHVKEFIN